MTDNINSESSGLKIEEWDILKNKITWESQIVIKRNDGVLCILDDTAIMGGKLRALAAFDSDIWEVVGSVKREVEKDIRNIKDAR